MEEQRQKMAMQQKQQQAQVQAQQLAQMSVRKVIAKLQRATLQNFDALKEELAQTLANEFEKCGLMKEKLQQESDKALEQAAQKIEELKDRQAKAEEAKKEMERKRQESIEKAGTLFSELSDLTQAAEDSAKDVQTGVTEFKENATLDTVDKATSAAEAVEKLIEEAKEKGDACQAFVKAHGAEMRVLPPGIKKPPTPAKSDEAKEEKEAEEEEKPSLQGFQKLQLRINNSKVLVDSQTRALKLAVSVAQKKAQAMQEMKMLKAAFAKHDKDKDGMLNKKEILAYAKSEYKFTVPEIALENIFKAIAQDGKGVKAADFHRLTVAIGVARERARDQERRKAREEFEKELAEKKAQVQAQIDEATEKLKAAEADAAEANKKAATLAKEAKAMKATEMLAKADEAKGATKATADKAAEAVKCAAEFAETVEVGAELKSWLDLAKKKMKAASSILELQAQRPLRPWRSSARRQSERTRSR